MGLSISLEGEDVISTSTTASAPSSSDLSRSLVNGINNYSQSQYHNAINNFTQVLEKDPTNKTARTYLKKSTTRLYQMEKEKYRRERAELLKEARGIFSEYLAEERRIKRNAEPIYKEAQKHYNKGQYILAYEKLNKIMLNYPRYQPAKDLFDQLEKDMANLAMAGAEKSPDRVYYAKGYLAYRKQDFNGALNEWNKVLDINPRTTELIDYIKKIKDYLADQERLAREKESEEKVKRLFGEGVQDFDRKLWVSSIKKMEGVQKICKEEPFPAALDWHNKAQDYISRAVSELAKLAEVQKPKEVKPATPASPPPPPEPEVDTAGAERKYNEGLVHYAQGRLSDAIKSWEVALRLNPGHEKARRALDKTKMELELQKKK